MLVLAAVCINCIIVGGCLVDFISYFFVPCLNCKPRISYQCLQIVYTLSLLFISLGYLFPLLCSAACCLMVDFSRIRNLYGANLFQYYTDQGLQYSPEFTAEGRILPRKHKLISTLSFSRIFATSIIKVVKLCGSFYFLF